MELYKRYVDVILQQQKDGKIIPMYICWENGRKYKIDQVLSHSPGISETGGSGMRYVCLIKGEMRSLYLEKNRWFIESQRP